MVLDFLMLEHLDIISNCLQNLFIEETYLLPNASRRVYFDDTGVIEDRIFRYHGGQCNFLHTRPIANCDGAAPLKIRLHLEGEQIEWNDARFASAVQFN